MELQQAVALLELTGKKLTEKIVNRAYNVKSEKIEDRAISAPTGELVQKYMVILDNLKEAQHLVLKSLIEEPLPEDNIATSPPSLNNSERKLSPEKTSIPSIPQASIDTVKNIHNKKAVHKRPQDNKKGSIINSVQSLAFSIGLVFLAAIVGLYHQGWFDQLLEDFKPVDENTFIQLRVDGGKLQQEIQDIIAQLENGVSELESELEEAQKNTSGINANLIKRLSLALRLTQYYLIGGDHLDSLYADFEEAQSLLSDQTLNIIDSRKMIMLFHTVKYGYQDVLEQFNAVLKLHPVKQSATQARVDLMDALAQYQLVAPIDIAEAEQFINKAKVAENAKQYKEALNQYQKATPNFEELLDRIEILQSAMIAANKVKNKLALTAKKAGIDVPDAKKANDLMVIAYNTSNEGKTTLAISMYKQAKQRWEQEFDRLERDIGLMNEAAEEAKAIEEAKLSKQEATQALEATKLATTEASPKVLQTMLGNDLIGKLVFIPDGSFKMGSYEGGRTERPVHTVKIKSFKIMEHPVTFEQWDECIIDGGCSYIPDDEGWGRDSRPVIAVSYRDITEQYIPWLNKSTGLNFSLPSESQWEYATRAGSTSKFSWGDKIGTSFANCESCSSWNRHRTVPVKSYEANAWGLYDMLGNVNEWTQDCWNSSYDQAPTDGSVWLDGECGQAVLRGGAWDSDENQLRSAARNASARDTRDMRNGFRLIQN